MGKGKNRNKKGEQGSTSKEAVDFLSDPMFAKALARIDVTPVGWANGTTGSAIVNQRKVKTATAPIPSGLVNKLKFVEILLIQ